METNFKQPILFIIFNKKEETKRVFYAIREQKPAQLFIAADGAREDKDGEKEKCELIRTWVLDNIDWECDVKTLFRDQNVGCGHAPAEAITWFFEQVDEGIILEDDCLPNESFFKFCEELLPKYRNDTSISIVSGNNFQPDQPLKLDGDYYYSIFPSTNGWASWKCTWEGYDFNISSWKKLNKKSFLKFLFIEKKYQEWWRIMFDTTLNNPPQDAWDWQFHFHCMSRRQLAIIPKANLISNIGYGPDSTHFSDPNYYFANFKMYDMEFPLIHPSEISRNYEADVFIQDNLFGEAEVIPFAKKVKRAIKKQIRRVK